MADRRRMPLLLVAGLLAATGVCKAGDAVPDMAFIEYLGSWEEDDRDWVALAGTASESNRPAGAEKRREHMDEETDSNEEED